MRGLDGVASLIVARRAPLCVWLQFGLHLLAANIRQKRKGLGTLGVLE